MGQLEMVTKVRGHRKVKGKKEGGEEGVEVEVKDGELPSLLSPRLTALQVYSFSIFSPLNGMTVFCPVARFGGGQRSTGDSHRRSNERNP